MNKKLGILVFGVLVIGVVIGLFADRIQESFNDTDRGGNLTFGTQSVGGSAPSQTVDISCPWSEDILDNEDVIVANPLSDISHSLLSIQKGLESATYDMWGGIHAGDTTDTPTRRAMLGRNSIDSVVAKMQGKKGFCAYYNNTTLLFGLTQVLDYKACKEKNNLGFVGFTCNR